VSRLVISLIVNYPLMLGWVEVGTYKSKKVSQKYKKYNANQDY